MDVPRFLCCLRDVVERASRQGVRSLVVVLLGDVFEILKSKIWLTTTARPWQPSSKEHCDVVRTIFDSIVKVNQDFFEGLDSLGRSYSFLQIVYVPGNHDREMNSLMGEPSRRKFQALLPLGRTDGQLFLPRFYDEEHGVLAQHGHEWDSTNRTSETLAAIGDAVVIELLLRLPNLLAERLGVEEKNAGLRYLYELDNVRPQHPRVMAAWLLSGLDHLAKNLPGARTTLHDVLGELMEGLRKVVSTSSFESVQLAHWWIDLLSLIITKVLRKYGVLRAAIRLPGHSAGDGPYRDFAAQNLQAAQEAGVSYRYILCGHTHVPELVPLDLGSGGTLPLPLYINTAAWRRVHCPAGVTPKGWRYSFATWYEECLVCIFNDEEQGAGHPPYEIYRSTRGEFSLGH